MGGIGILAAGLLLLAIWACAATVRWSIQRYVDAQAGLVTGAGPHNRNPHFAYTLGLFIRLVGKQMYYWHIGD